MKNRLTLGLLISAALFGSPALKAEGAPSGEGEKKEGLKQDDLMKKPIEELIPELLRLLDEVSVGMDKLESEIAKASREPRKPDEVAAEAKAVAEKLKQGDKAELPEGLKQYFKDNPGKLAQVLGVTEEEAKKVAGNGEELAKKLGQSADGLNKLLEDGDVLSDIAKKQADVERELRDVLKKQEELSAKARKDLEDLLEVAYAMRQQ